MNAHNSTLPTMLSLLRALAGPAVLLLPWVHFDNEPHYHPGLLTMAYPFRNGWMPVFEQTSWTWSWLMPVLPAVIALGVLWGAAAALTGRPAWKPAVFILAVATAWLIIAGRFYDHPVGYGIPALYAVYGMEIASAVSERLNKRYRWQPAGHP